MLLDAAQIPSETTIRTDVCIVGAGAAGIAIGRELMRGDLDVLLIESGGLEPDPAAQALAVGENAGDPYWPLDANRTRAVGGTTALWAGWCRPLDEIDYEARDWVGLSGWPFGPAELRPFYEGAAALCELEGDDDVATWEHALGAPRLPLPADEVETRIYRLSPPTRFGPAFAAELRASPRLRLLTSATAMEIETTGSGHVVSRVRVGSLDGNRFWVAPRCLVLAAGAIENARLLLLSGGLGNEHDLVGRCFMERPHFASGRLRLMEPVSTRLYHGGPRAIARLCLPPHVQERERLLNYNLMLEAPPRRLMPWAARARTFRLRHTLEQAPDPESRVQLGTSRDAFGLPRPVLRWRTGELERWTVRRGQRLIGEALARAGLGTLEEEPGLLEHGWPSLQGERGHHLGVTRMDPDPRRGVVDADARVHGVENLYVAGGSVFPTAGAGPPTLTILALALRLAEHVAAVVGRERAQVPGP